MILDMFAIGLRIVAKAVSHIGEREIGDSNTGPQVDKYLAYVGLDPGQEWCAAAACYWVGTTLVQIGLPTYAHPKTGSTGAIHVWGINHAATVGRTSVFPGCVGCLIDHTTNTGYRHTVLVRTVDHAAGTFTTVEGNDQNAVRSETRHLSNFDFVRPWKQP